jgi:hypothetical protein
MRAENVLAGPDYMTCDSDGLVLDLDVVTALGIVVTEVVTNSYDHAFPGGKGAINVSVRRAAGDVEMATMTISDNDGGFKAELDSKRHGLGPSAEKAPWRKLFRLGEVWSANRRACRSFSFDRSQSCSPSSKAMPATPASCHWIRGQLLRLPPSLRQRSLSDLSPARW